MIEVGQDNSGLVIAPDPPGFFEPLRRKSAKKRTMMSRGTLLRNRKMLELARDSRHWSNRDAAGRSVIYTANPFTPPQWKDAVLPLQAIAYQLALEELAQLHGGTALCLSFNLTPDFTRKAFANGGPTFIHDRLSKRLSRLGVAAEFWLAIEAVVKGKYGGWNYHQGRPHIHGSVLLRSGQEGAFRQAIRSLNGSASLTFRQNETRLQALDDEKGGGRAWAAYAFKHHGYNQLFLPGTRMLARTRGISSMAKATYERDRAIVRAVKHAVSSSATSDVR